MRATTRDTIICTLKTLPQQDWIAAAARAVQINPANAPTAQLRLAAAELDLPPEHLAVLTDKYWGQGEVHLTVGFFGSPPAALRAKILSHMNAWNQWANVQFVETTTDPQVRVALTPALWPGLDGGYWSYHGTDILAIAPDHPTMMLEGFSLATLDSEFVRVVRHETGHTLGFPHEHKRQEIVNRIDRDKAIAYFKATQGWSADKTVAQVLTPLDTSALVATAQADPQSIMCYWLPASIMKDQIAVTGGADIDSQDAAFAAMVYPKSLPWSHAVDAADRLSNDVDNIVVANNQDGGLEVFMRGHNDGHLYHKWQTAPNTNNWSHPVSAADRLSNDVTWFAVAQNQDGRLEVFMRGSRDGHLYHKWQTAPNTNNWSHTVGAADRLSNDVDQIVVARNRDGRLEAFMRGHNDGHLYHKWQTAPNSNNWSHPVGAADRLSNDVSWFAVAQNQDGRLEVFMRGTNDGHLYHKWQSPGGGWSHPVGAADRLSLNVGQFALAQNQDGRLEVFMRGSNDGHLYHKCQTAPNSNNWVPAGEAAADRLAIDVSWVEAGRNRDGRLEVFFRSSRDGHLYHKWQIAPNSNNWTYIVSFAAMLTRDVDGSWPLLLLGQPSRIDFATAPRGFVVAKNQDGRLEVFVRGNNDGHLYHKWQTI